MNLPRKRIEEVRVRLSREKGIREIYVEGVFDRDFFRWVLNNAGMNDIRVYPISTLEIPQEYLDALGLTSGERQRLIAVAHTFESDHSLHDQLAFVIDADSDYILDQANYKPPLLGTDGTCTEVIFWQKELLQKFLSMGLGCSQPETSATKLMQFVEPIVTSISIFRATKQKLGLNWKLIDVADAIDRRAGFCFKTYCEKVGDKNAARNIINTSFANTLKDMESRAANLEPAKKLHGHDLMAAVCRKLSIDGYQQKCLTEPEELGRLLMSSLEWGFVCKDLTILSIIERFRGFSN